MYSHFILQRKDDSNSPSVNAGGARVLARKLVGMRTWLGAGPCKLNKHGIPGVSRIHVSAVVHTLSADLSGGMEDVLANFSLDA